MISIIIPAYNSEKTIGDCLKVLSSQNYPKNKYEVIVVDDGSIDNTKNIVKKFRKFKFIEQNHNGPAVARNLGAKKSKGEIILFTDSDCIPSKNWIRNMVKPFENKEIVGVQGTYKTYNKKSLIARFAGYEIEQRHEKLKKQKYIDFIGTFSAGYRRKIFSKFGGFDIIFKMASGEDTELSFKLSNENFKMVFEPKAFVYHRHPDNLKKFLRQKFWRGYWRIPLYRKHNKKMLSHSYTPRIIFLRTFLIAVFISFSFLNIINLLSYKYTLILSLLLIVSTLPLSFKILKKDKFVGVLTPFIIILRDFFTGLGILFGLKNFWKNK